MFDYHHSFAHNYPIQRLEMRCPRCDSHRIQRDYEDARALMGLFGVRKLLCNTCGHVFHGFDPLGRHNRAPVKQEDQSHNRRQNPRFPAHLPTDISLILGTPADGKVTYSEPSKGHCDSISKIGMGLSLVGSRFLEEDLSRMGRLLFIRTHLPQTTIEAVVSILSSRRTAENKKWFIGVKLQQISDSDKASLVSYLKQRAEERPLVHLD